MSMFGLGNLIGNIMGSLNGVLGSVTGTLSNINPTAANMSPGFNSLTSAMQSLLSGSGNFSDVFAQVRAFQNSQEGREIANQFAAQNGFTVRF